MRNERTVLIVSDNPAVRQATEDALRAAGYNPAASRREDAVGRVREEQPQLILLEMTRESSDRDFTGWNLRQNGTPLVLMAMEGSGDVDRAFLMGGPDCITDPLDAGETAARVREALRRSRPSGTGAVLEFGDLRISINQRLVEAAGRPVNLSKTEFEILRTLAESPG